MERISTSIRVKLTPKEIEMLKKCPNPESRGRAIRLNLSPRSDKPARKRHRIFFEITAEMDSWLNETAKNYNTDKATLVRAFISQEMENPLWQQ